MRVNLIIRHDVCLPGIAAIGVFLLLMTDRDEPPTAAIEAHVLATLFAERRRSEAHLAPQNAIPVGLRTVIRRSHLWRLVFVGTVRQIGYLKSHRLFQRQEPAMKSKKNKS
jgi:hypothetical protein